MTDDNSAKTAQFCIELILRHTPLNSGEAQLIEAIANDIRVAFGLEGAVNRTTLPRTNYVPKDWFW